MEKGVRGDGCIDGRRSVEFRRYVFGGCGGYIFGEHVLGVFGGYQLGGYVEYGTLVNALVEVEGFFWEGVVKGFGRYIWFPYV